MEPPRVRYARSGDVSIAYTEIGSAPTDLIFVHGFVSNLDWREPRRAAFFERLTSFARVIQFDRRGTGLSDRVRDIPTLETRMDDLRAVMDAAGSERAALLGTVEAAAMTALFSATYPERVGALLIYNPVAKGVWAPDYPFAPTKEEWRKQLEEIRAGWGDDDYFDQLARELAPSQSEDPEFMRLFRSSLRQGASPGAVVAIERMAMDVDIRDVLPSIRVPTLVLHRPLAREEACFIASASPGRAPSSSGVPTPCTSSFPRSARKWKRS